jgi:hypothetical protein
MSFQWLTLNLRFTLAMFSKNYWAQWFVSVAINAAIPGVKKNSKYFSGYWDLVNQYLGQACHKIENVVTQCLSLSIYYALCHYCQ